MPTAERYQAMTWADDQCLAAACNDRSLERRVSNSSKSRAAASENGSRPPESLCHAPQQPAPPQSSRLQDHKVDESRVSYSIYFFSVYITIYNSSILLPYSSTMVFLGGFAMSTPEALSFPFFFPSWLSCLAPADASPALGAIKWT